METIRCSKSAMLKGVVLTLCAFVCLQNSFAQEANNGVHPYKETSNVAPLTAHWLLYLDAGGNWFDGDYPLDKVNGIYGPTVGLGFAYQFNPTWSLGLEGQYSMLRITGKDGQTAYDKDNPAFMSKQMYRVQAVSSFDLFNAWYPASQKHKIFALNVLVGGGMGIYNRTNYLSYDTYKDIINSQASDDKGHYEVRPLIMAGADLQFNVSRSISIGIKATYTYFMKDDIDGRYKGSNNDGIVDFGLSLRYKIAAVKKSHECNVANENYFDPVTRAAKQEKKPAKTDATSPAKPAQKDTVVIVQRDTVVVNNTTTVIQESAAADDYYYIYFANNASTLSTQDLATIQQVASRLKRNENLYIEIVGYCDNTGSDQYNKALGKKRSHNVMDEFVEEHDINPERIIAHSGGIIKGKRSKAAYGPNRRAEIRLLNKQQFDAAKQQYVQEQEQERQKTAQEATPDYSDVANDSTIVVDMQLSGNIIATETTRADWTLSKMARKHYGNTYCWVYIYQANKANISSPDKIQPGMNIDIPELNAQQQGITKKQARKVLANL